MQSGDVIHDNCDGMFQLHVEHSHIHHIIHLHSQIQAFMAGPLLQSNGTIVFIIYSYPDHSHFWTITQEILGEKLD